MKLTTVLAALMLTPCSLAFAQPTAPMPNPMPREDQQTAPMPNPSQKEEMPRQEMPREEKGSPKFKSDSMMDRDYDEEDFERDHRGMGMHGKPWRKRMPPAHGAHFKFEKNDSEVHIKCAANESTAACVDGAILLLDKLKEAKN
ncbi:MAG: hypothetical protein SGJ17_06050 [Hyphomicrobiales bacterium]|nr:hypothetical protein [Hyphomicrobiales bacterium]